MSLSLWRNLDDWWDPHREITPYWRRNRPFDEFGAGLYPSELLIPQELRRIEKKAREIQEQMMKELEEMSPKTGKEGFQVCVDVGQFKPNEVTVKTNDRYVTVEGKHEERKDNHGYISRQFQRRYSLPPDVIADTITSELSTDGVLTVKAPVPKALEEGGNERIINIQQTGPARFNVKMNEAIESKPKL